MKLALAIISFFHGYLVWAGTGIAPFWLKRNPPATPAEIAIRWSILVIIVVLMGVTNLTTNGRKNSRITRVLWRTSLVFTGFYVLCVFLSGGLDQIFFDDVQFLSNFRHNPWMILLEPLLLNAVALLPSSIVFAILEVSRRFRPNDDIDLP